MVRIAYKGSCLCGDVQFEITGSFQSFYLCYCQHCRKDTGSGHASNLFSNTATLNWLQGADSTTTFQLPDTQHIKCFCRRCGSALPYQSETLGIVVPAGCLDTNVELRPTAAIFTSRKPGWAAHLDDLPSFDLFPS
ncbi:GFA family protein [Photobacterium ganghwense]|uniref:GFA family protein n=1 Tax=Photobacterium ganghwense TaxID=320778 RepID=UPI001A8CDC5A|nr:GFA family protein [Photobacterium ganghwense]QSV16033.1 GFA family protein [Photobacterium ganghwense]